MDIDYFTEYNILKDRIRELEQENKFLKKRLAEKGDEYVSEKSMD